MKKNFPFHGESVTQPKYAWQTVLATTYIKEKKKVATFGKFSSISLLWNILGCWSCLGNIFGHCAEDRAGLCMDIGGPPQSIHLPENIYQEKMTIIQKYTVTISGEYSL